jgi:hypothetical protein
MPAILERANNEDKNMMNKIEMSGSDFTVRADELQSYLLEALKACGTPGQDNSEAVEYVRANWEVTADPEQAKAYLRPFGAWDEEELANHQQNLDRLVWIIGCELRESDEAYLAGY